tara:strand:+ start:1229 stop:1414 length:186 start_codon:yes stop_codon:yes gene_type:complete
MRPPYLTPDPIPVPDQVTNKEDYKIIARLDEREIPSGKTPNPARLIKVGSRFYRYEDIKID